MLDYLASDMSEEEILEDFPDLTPTDLKACIAFAAEALEKQSLIAGYEQFTTDYAASEEMQKEAESWLDKTSGT